VCSFLGSISEVFGSTKVVGPAPANGVELFPDHLSETSSNRALGAS
jgi:hypothetical protein